MATVTGTSTERPRLAKQRFGFGHVRACNDHGQSTLTSQPNQLALFGSRTSGSKLTRPAKRTRPGR
jgi:hypothetical protein